MSRGELPSIDQAILERARFWHTGERLAGKQIEQTWFGKLPVKEVRLHAVHAGALIRELENRGVSKGTMMPSLDRVVESLELQRSIG